ncbi:hypothetical protein K523DRAFT_203643, partial [Schizophyllum commune Tattone D]
ELALVLSDKTIRIYRWPYLQPASMRQSNRLRSYFHPQHVVRVKYCPSGDRLALTTGSSTIEVLDIGENRVPTLLGVIECARGDGSVVLAFDWQDYTNLVAAIRTETGRIHVRKYTLPGSSDTWNELADDSIDIQRLKGIAADIIASQGKVTVAAYDELSASITVHLPDGESRVLSCGVYPLPSGFSPVTLVEGGRGVVIWQDGAVRLYDARGASAVQQLPSSPTGVLLAVIIYVQVDSIYRQLVITNREQGPSHRVIIYHGDISPPTIWSSICTWSWMFFLAFVSATVTAILLQWSGYGK